MARESSQDCHWKTPCRVINNLAMDCNCGWNEATENFIQERVKNRQMRKWKRIANFSPRHSLCHKRKCQESGMIFRGAHDTKVLSSLPTCWLTFLLIRLTDFSWCSGLNFQFIEASYLLAIQSNEIKSIEPWGPIPMMILATRYCHCMERRLWFELQFK